jgi:hypothetical protein
MTDVALQAGSPEIPDKLYFKIGEVSELLRIKHLLYEQRFTIEGARQTLQSEARSPKARRPKQAQQELFATDPLPEIRRELADILEMLK